MAEFAEPVVSFLLENITKLLIEEAQFLGGVSEQAEQLQSKMRLMLSLLREADKRQDEHAPIREWISQSKIVAYDTENALEAFAFNVGSRRGKGVANFLKRYSCILSECYMRHRVGSEIQNLHSRISDLTRSFNAYGIRDIMWREGPSSRQPRLLRRTYSHVEENDFVGLENDVELLVQHLTNEHEVSPHSVVSICGMGGIGKTTIARKVYNHPNVRRHFDAFAWACVSQQWQTEDILQGILLKILPENREKILKWTEDELFRHLFEIQENKSCLIVLDDIWSTDAWDHLKHAFPSPERSRSKILLTTRKLDVATYVEPSGFHHQPRLLRADESWDLLQKKASRGGNSVDHGFEKLGEEIAKCCAGLPLAVVVIGGILATKHSLDEWREVHKNIKSLLERGEKIGQEAEFQKILALSYYDLPYELKPCFLYLSIYPEDCDIRTEALYHLWLAEGMVLQRDRNKDESMMDVAERYLGELVKRSMIQVSLKDEPAIRKFKSCRLHDLMRDLCLAKARDENFMTIIDSREVNNGELADLNSSTSSSKCHRMVIFWNGGNESKYVPPKREMVQHVRSLTFDRLGGDENDEVMAISKFNNFRMLRALTMKGIFGGMNLEIGGLIHLRYLCVRKFQFSMLPSSLDNLEHLETLDLRGTVRPLMKNVVWKMKNLRHLYLPYSYEDALHNTHVRYFYTPYVYAKFEFKLSLLGLSKLEILENLDSSMCEIKDLLKLSNVQVLKSLDISKENECEEIINFISDSQRLKEASVKLSMYKEFLSSEKWLALVEKLFGSNLCHLSLEGPLRVLPEYKTHFFQNLVELKLSKSRIEINLMGTLEKLPSLQNLWLRSNAFVGGEIICSNTGFPQLRYLLLDHLEYLREWRVENGAMPNLSSLKIDNCYDLEKIPDGLQFVRKLKELEIRAMPESFFERIMKPPEGEEGEDFYKVRHVPSIVIYY